jgi:hypothetical protein
VRAFARYRPLLKLFLHLHTGPPLAAMSAVSANPFAMLDDDDDAPAAAPEKKEVTKRTPNPAPKKDAPAAAAAKGSDKPAGRGPAKDGKRPPKREFDRHSGTGRGARSDGHEEKKGGHGKGNWGGNKDTTPEDAEPKELTEEEIAAAEAAAEEKRKEAAALTLEEYRKKQAAAAEAAAAEKKAAREPEKVDMKGLKLLTDPDDVEEIRIGASTQKKQAAKEKKGKEIITDLNFVTAPIEQPSPSGGRGSCPSPTPIRHPSPHALRPSRQPQSANPCTRPPLLLGPRIWASLLHRSRNQHRPEPAVLAKHDVSEPPQPSPHNRRHLTNINHRHLTNIFDNHRYPTNISEPPQPQTPTTTDTSQTCGFADSFAGGRGGRGGGPRGGGGRGGGRSAPAANLNLADDSSFPTL